jgi:hypothetical protein
LKTQEEANCLASVGSRRAERYLFSKTNREPRPARNFVAAKIYLSETPAESPALLLC